MDECRGADIKAIIAETVKQVSDIMETMRHIISYYSKALKWPRIYSIFVHFAQYCVTLVIRLSCQKDYQCIRENEYMESVRRGFCIYTFKKYNMWLRLAEFGYRKVNIKKCGLEFGCKI